MFRAESHNQGLVLILIIADQTLGDCLRHFYKYNCLCSFIGNLNMLCLTFLISLSQICINLGEIYFDLT